MQVHQWLNNLFVISAISMHGMDDLKTLINQMIKAGVIIQIYYY